MPCRNMTSIILTQGPRIIGMDRMAISVGHFDQAVILLSTFYRCHPMRCDTTTRNGSPRAPDSEAIGVPGLVEPDGSAGKLPPRTRDRERSPIEPEFLAA